MSWINLASTRFDLLRQAHEAVDRWDVLGMATGRAMLPGLYALIAGDQEVFQQALAKSRTIFERDLAKIDKGIGQPGLLSRLIGLSALFHVGGIDQTPLWQRIVDAPPPEDNPYIGHLQWTASRLAGATPAPPSSGSRRSTLRTERQWMDMLETTPTRDLFDLAMCPDHPLWIRTLYNLALPLGILLARELWEQGVMVRVDELVQKGAYPERHPRVVYERQHKRPEWTVESDPVDPATWFGFDAVEIVDGQVRIYHWLGWSWQAPLVFQQTRQHAFRTLDHLEQSWQLVRDRVSGEVWDEIEALQKAGKCQHVIVHERSVSMSMPSHIRRAMDHYGVDIGVEDRASA